jgi:tetratricopeptide (TPR) repeat protein
LKLKRWLSFSLLLIATGLSQNLTGVGTEIITIRDLCYQQNYPAATELLARICNQPDKQIAGLFWQTCLLQLLIYDFGNIGLVDSFYHTCDRVIENCSRQLKEHPDDATAHLYFGLTLLNQANLLSWQNKKFHAFLTLLKVNPHLQRALALNPELYDARFGLAVIEYFKATADRYCFGLGLLGSRERAYQLMTEAREKAHQLQPMAEFMLAFMYKEDHNYPAAIESCNRLLSRYPGNRTARRLLRDIYLAMGSYQQAIALGRELEAELSATAPDNRYARSENWLKLTYAWTGAGIPDSARTYADRIINWQNYSSSVPWLSEYVREAKRMKNRQCRL